MVIRHSTLLLLFVLVATVSVQAQPFPVGNVPDGRYTLNFDGIELSTPMLSSHSLDEIHPEITRAILFVPDTTREVMISGQRLAAQADTADAEATTLIVGLQFLIIDDVVEYELEDTNVAYWPRVWHSGFDGLSRPEAPRDTVVSSFVYMDSLMYRVSDICPNLQTMVISGGGTYVHRFACGTSVPEEFELGDPDGIHLTRRPPVLFLAATIDAFLYLNESRPQYTGGFAAVGNLFESYVPEYNWYPFGLENLVPYMAEKGVSFILSRYPHKNMVYFCGENDTYPNWDNQNRLIQGLNNKMIAILYPLHLEQVFGATITHRLIIAKNVGPYDILSASELRPYLFEYIPSGYGYLEMATNVDYDDATPTDYRVQAVYPNPFNASTQVAVTLPTATAVTIRVFNVMGQEVARLADGQLSAGEHTFTFDAAELASGTYFLHVQAPGKLAELQKLTLVK